MKKMLSICMIAILIWGCSSAENEKNREMPSLVEEQKIQLSDMINVDEAKIMDIVYYPMFTEGVVVQNEKYVFYPNEGNEIIRIDKNNCKRKKIIQLKKAKKKRVGAQICISNDRLYVAYDANVTSYNFDGKKEKYVVKNIGKKISSMVDSSIQNDPNIIQGMQYYKGELFLFLSDFSILKLDLESKNFTQLASQVKSACLKKGNLYFIKFHSDKIYNMDIKTNKCVLVRGQKGEESNSDSEIQNCYKEILALDNEIYYVWYDKKKRTPIIYKYCDGGEDEMIFGFQSNPDDSYVVHKDPTRVICEYYNSGAGTTYLDIYDIRDAISYQVKVPEDFETTTFLAGDLLFYEKKTNDDLFLSAFALPR